MYKIGTKEKVTIKRIRGARFAWAPKKKVPISVSGLFRAARVLLDYKRIFIHLLRQKIKQFVSKKSVDWKVTGFLSVKTKEFRLFLTEKKASVPCFDGICTEIKTM